MTTLAEFMILFGADNRPPMLEKHLYDSWKSRKELYMQNREHGRMILESVEHGPLIWPMIEENGVTRTKKYEELSITKKIQADCDLKATNIIFQGLPSDVYSLVNHYRVAKDLWERIQLLMQGTSLTKQERECKLYNAFNKFAHIKRESLHQYYLRFTQLINDMNIYKMKLEQFQVNTKFLNSLPPEWSKFMTDVKLVRDLHTTNFDQLHAYLEQHELHANEVHIMRERNQDPLVLVANHQMTPSHFNTYQSSYNNPQFQQQFSPSQSSQYGSLHPTQRYSTTYPSTSLTITYPSAPYPNAYSSTVHQEACPQPQSIDSGLAVPVFKQGDDPIDAINKMMSFLYTVVSSCFPTTNNQLRNSSNPRQQAIIHDGRVTVQPVQRRQSSYDAGTFETRANILGTGGNNSGQQRVMKCFNCQGEGHMARQCPKPKRKRDAIWFRDKVLLVEAQGSAYQADDLDAYDSDCDDFSTSKAVLMANLSSYGLDVLSEVPHSEYTHNDMLNHSIQEMPYSEQTRLVNYPENEVNKDNLITYESLSVELERYKERVKLLEERQNVDLSTQEKLIMDDLIREKNAQFVDFEKENNYLKQTLSKQSKEKKLLTKTFNVFKNKSKEKEDKNIDKEIALEKKAKELDNIVCEMGQSAQTMHMLMKP
ncbi:integrase, catalytic region, zinc finger, CCHC-type containing protein [Tanacetum coccineum]